MNPLRELNQHGQFVWLDHISRSLIRGGGLQRLVDEDGLGGVTSNPTLLRSKRLQAAATTMAGCITPSLVKATSAIERSPSA